MAKNEHFLKLCSKGQLGSPVSDEKVSATKHLNEKLFKCKMVDRPFKAFNENEMKNEHFLKLCPEA